MCKIGDFSRKPTNSSTLSIIKDKNRFVNSFYKENKYSSKAGLQRQAGERLDLSKSIASLAE